MPNDFIVESVTEVGPTMFAVISHHEQPVRDATWTAPQEYFSQIRIPSIFWASWAVNSLLLDAIPISTLPVGTFAKISPLTLKPLGGQSGDGEGDTLLLFFGTLFFFGIFFTIFFLTTGALVFLAVGFALVFMLGAGLEFIVTFGDGVGLLLAALACGMTKARATVIAMAPLITSPFKCTN